MAEYINRESVLQILSSKNAAWDSYQKVQSIPAADVKPVVRGRYEATRFEALFSTRVCSECLNRVPIGHFCYMCGADMMEES